MAGRGRARGRARGLVEGSPPGGLASRDDANGEPEDGSEAVADDTSSNNSNESNAARQSHSTSGQPMLSLSDMKSIIEDSRTYNDQSDVKRVLICAQHFVRTEDDVKTLAGLFYKKCLEDSSLAKKGAEICDALSCIEVGNAKFRNSLLSSVQTDYKGRKELISNDPSRFKGFLAFLCEIFSVMRTATNEVFKPLANPIYDCFNLILGQDGAEEDNGGETVIGEVGVIDDDLCELFAIQLQGIGKLLEEVEESRMRRLMDRIRICIINSKSSPRVRCSLLEVLESFARGWEAAPSETTQFYCDMAVDMISGLVV